MRLSYALPLLVAVAFSASLALATPIARATTLPVRYLVEQNPLRRAATAATEVIFEAYADPACTDLLDSVPVRLGNVNSVTRSRLLRLPDSPRPPKVVELRHTISTSSAASRIYLVVTGPGVHSVGRACQVQFFAATGTQGAAGPGGPIGPPGPHTRVVAATGAHVGHLIGGVATKGSVIREVDGGVVGLILIHAEPLHGSEFYLYYANDDCTGVAWLQVDPDDLFAPTFVHDGVMYRSNGPAEVQQPRSRFEALATWSRCERLLPEAAQYAPTTTEDVSALVPPWDFEAVP